MSSAKKLDLVSVDNYVAGEFVSPVKHDSLGGVVYAMAVARRRDDRPFPSRSRTMRCRTICVGLPLRIALAVVCSSSFAATSDEAIEAGHRVYGEWRIRVRPDKGQEYAALIAEQGLPLFRAAGGRMVGWWTTLVGDLYEHLTIWEYDEMAAFEKAIVYLGDNEEFAQFVKARDPMLDGEENRFLKLAGGAEPPRIPETARFVIHERHRVPSTRRDEYLQFMHEQGLPLLKRHGFRPVGPWIVAIGDSSDVTYLFRFESLTERERLSQKFSDHVDAAGYEAAITRYTNHVVTRLLMPAAFATQPDTAPADASSTLLPHCERLAEGVYAAGFADRYGSANCGWARLGDETLLIDLPRGVPMDEFLDVVGQTAGAPARTVVLTHFGEGDAAVVESLLRQGVSRVVATEAICAQLCAAAPAIASRAIAAVSKPGPIAQLSGEAVCYPLDGIVAPAAAAIYLPRTRLLFAGRAVVHGPRTRLHGSDTARWVEELRRLEELATSRVVPGFGSWGGQGLIARQRRFLTELRRQVGYAVCQGRSRESLDSTVHIPAGELVWMPYDTPTAEDLNHVFDELTVPAAPFNGRHPTHDDDRPHALVLYADQPHEPGHIEVGLRPVFEAAGVVPHFTVDVRALSAENLAQVQLLVVLRDGLQRPMTGERSDFIWMTPEQERAVVEFVERGGGFLNLHNSMGLYPEDGPYLKLVGGRYIGHGPLERFRVEVVDNDHPITRGVSAFSVADEQHTPPYDAGKVRLLLQNRSDEGRVAAAGWCYEPGRGRLCHLANGHTRESLLHPIYQRLMRNAVAWCLRQELNEAPKEDDRSSGQDR
jgi:type 1 glutamine amidotransferase